MRHRSDNVGTIGYAQFNLSPLGFHAWANKYLDSYRDGGLPEQESLTSSLLLCRTIELELKAWHRQTTTQAVLKDKYRHDLIASYRGLPAKHRILSNDEVGLLESANRMYAKASLERIGVGRPGRRFEHNTDLAAVDALTTKLMKHGDEMDLA